MIDSDVRGNASAQPTIADLRHMELLKAQLRSPENQNMLKAIHDHV